MRHPAARSRAAALALLLAAPAIAPAQTADVPIPPPVLQVFEELIKPGHAGAHATTEAEWPRVLNETGAPVYYIAMNSLTGDNRMRFMSGWTDFAQMDESDRAIEKITGLGIRLEQLAAVDGAHLDRYSSFLARLVPELSYDGTDLDLAHARMMEVITIEVRPGQEASFAEASGMYVAKARELGISTNWATYRIEYGRPGTTWLVITVGRELPEFGGDSPADHALQAAFSPAERRKLEELFGRSIVTFESHLWRFAPRFSHVTDAFAARDPEYWMVP